jgi:hypothetical protein
MATRNPTRPCANPASCHGTMRPQIGLSAPRQDERPSAQKRNAWVCETCGCEEPLTAFTGTHLLLYTVTVVVLALLVNFSPLQRWKLPLYLAFVIVAPAVVYLIARKAER